MELEVGDKLRVLGVTGFWHYGIYVGRRRFSGEDVVHNDKNGGVQLVDLSEFAGGQPVEVVSRVSGSWHEREMVAQRALGLLGKQYDLVNFNCEHLANYAQTGQAASPQLGLVVLVLGVLGLIWAASRA